MAFGGGERKESCIDIDVILLICEKKKKSCIDIDVILLIGEKRKLYMLIMFICWLSGKRPLHVEMSPFKFI